jgi:hypothetical protein
MGYNAAAVVTTVRRRYDHPISVRDLIASGPLAHLTTINPDGSPKVVFPPEPIRSQPGYITHIAPQRFTGTGPWSSAHGS